MGRVLRTDVVYPKKDDDLSKFMNWFTPTHTQHWPS